MTQISLLFQFLKVSINCVQKKMCLKFDDFNRLLIDFLINFFSELAYALVTNMGVTAGAHRLWSHKAYKAKRPLQLILGKLLISKNI